jgi:hypothetical protein
MHYKTQYILVGFLKLFYHHKLLYLNLKFIPSTELCRTNPMFNSFFEKYKNEYDFNFEVIEQNSNDSEV